MHCLTLAVSLVVTAAASLLARQHVDPPLLLTLHIDGQEHAFVDGEERTLTIGGQETKVKASVAPTRRFDATGVQFDFPRDMPLEFEDDGLLPHWTLDGSNVIVMIFSLDTGVDDLAATILRGQAQALGADIAEPTATKLNLGGVTHEAVEVRAGRADVIQMHIVAADIDVGDRRLTVVVQHTLTDDGSQSADSKRMLELLAKTWTVPAAR